jgi:FKBP-type peptidyl-prolyl cis-trans isomerase (trigger factor)
MTTAVSRQDDGTVELTISIPWVDVEKTYQLVVDDMAKEAEMPGFRKGKAPRKLVEDSVDKTKAYEEAIRRIVPQAYSDAITEHKLTPILMPQIELKEAQEGKDWIVSARTCEAPKVEVGEYKKVIVELKERKSKKIAVSGKEDDTKDGKPTIDEVLGALLSVTKIKLPAILVEHETNHQLSQLIDQTKKLGLSVEQYLASTGKTSESIRADYAQQTQRSLSLEFALEAVANKEGVKVADADIAKLLATAKSDEERKSLEKEQYYLTTLVKRQKTVDVLMAL